VAIKKAFEYKKSGYYWLKGPCTKTPLRAFCDYQSGSVDYTYIGGLGRGKNMRFVRNIY
jgi:hypothetical protein